MSDQSQWKALQRRDRLVAELLHRLAEGACAERLRVVARDLVELREEFIERVAGRIWKDQALCFELRAVVRKEQALLLREAIELLLAHSVEGRIFGAACASASSEPEWRRRCAEEIGCALSDSMPVMGELLVCSLEQRSVWPCAEQLVAPLLRVHSTAETRATCARALFAAGRRTSARRLAGSLNAAELSGGARARLLCALATDAERAGRESEALDLFERSASCGANEGEALSALLLALRLRREASVAWSLDRLREGRSTTAQRVRALRDLEDKRELIQRPLSALERSWLESCLDERHAPLYLEETVEGTLEGTAEGIA